MLLPPIHSLAPPVDMLVQVADDAASVAMEGIHGQLPAIFLGSRAAGAFDNALGAISGGGRASAENAPLAIARAEGSVRGASAWIDRLVEAPDTDRTARAVAQAIKVRTESAASLLKWYAPSGTSVASTAEPHLRAARDLSYAVGTYLQFTRRAAPTAAASDAAAGAAELPTLDEVSRLLAGAARRLGFKDAAVEGAPSQLAAEIRSVELPEMRLARGIEGLSMLADARDVLRHTPSSPTVDAVLAGTGDAIRGVLDVYATDRLGGLETPFAAQAVNGLARRLASGG